MQQTRPLPPNLFFPPQPPTRATQLQWSLRPTSTIYQAPTASSQPSSNNLCTNLTVHLQSQHYHKRQLWYLQNCLNTRRPPHYTVPKLEINMYEHLSPELKQEWDQGSPFSETPLLKYSQNMNRNKSNRKNSTYSQPNSPHETFTMTTFTFNK